MECQTWITTIVNWVNCLGVVDKPIADIAELKDGLVLLSILKAFVDNDVLSKSKVPTTKMVAEFLSNEYPAFVASDKSSLDTQEVVFLSSLLIHYSCIRCQHEFLKDRMCKHLSGVYQLQIMTFLQTLMDKYSHNISRETISASIPPETPKTSPIEDKLKLSPISSPFKLSYPGSCSSGAGTPNSKFRNEKTREIKKLQAELDSEKFDKAYLEEKLKTQADKIQTMSRDLEEKVLEIKRLRQELISSDLENTPPNAAKPLERSPQDARMRMEIVRLEDCVDKLQTEIDEVRNERDETRDKLVSLNKKNQLIEMKVAELETENEHLLEDAVEKSRELESLRELCSELNLHVLELRTLQHHEISIEGLDVSITQFLPKTPSPGSSENLGSSVIDIQLREKQQENLKLREDLTKILSEHSLLNDQYNTVETKLVDVEAKHHLLEKKNKELENKVLLFDQANLDLKETAKNLDIAMKELDSRARENDLLASSADSLKIMLDCCRSDLEQTRLQAKLAANDLETLQREFKVKQQCLQQHIEQVEQLQCENVSLKEEMLKSSTAIKHRFRNLINLIQPTETSITTESSIDAFIDVLQDVIIEVQMQNKQLNIEISHTSTDFKSASDKIVSLNEVCRQYTNKITELEEIAKEKNYLVNQLELMQKSLDSKDCAIENIKTNEKMLQNEIEFSKMQLKELKDSHNELLKAYNLTKSELQNMMINLDDLTQQLQSCLEEKADIGKQLNLKNKELDDLMLRNNTLLLDFNSTQTETEKLTIELNEVNIKVNELQESCAKLSIERTALLAKVDMLSNTIVDINNREQTMTHNFEAEKSHNSALHIQLEIATQSLVDKQRELDDLLLCKDNMDKDFSEKMIKSNNAYMELSNEVNDLKQQLKLYEKKNEDLQTEQNHLNRQIEVVQSEKISLQESYDLSIVEHQNRIINIENKMSELKMKHASLHIALEEKNLTLKQLEESTDSISKTCAQEILEKDSRILNLDDTISQLKNVIVNLKHELLITETKLEDAGKENIKAAVNITELEEIKLRLEAELAIAKQHIIQLTLDFKNEQQSRSVSIQKTDKKLKKRDECINKLQTSVTDLNEHIQRIESNLCTVREENKKLSDDVKLHEDTKTQLQTELTHAHDQIKICMEKMVQAEKEINNTLVENTQKLNERDLQISVLKKSLVDLNAKVTTIQTKLDSANEENNKAVLLIKYHEKRKSQLEMELSSAQEQVNQFKNQVQEYEVEKNNAIMINIQLLNEKEAHIQLLQTSVSGLNEQILNIETSLQDAKEENVRSTLIIKQLQDDKDQMEAELAEAQTQLKRYNVQVEQAEVEKNNLLRESTQNLKQRDERILELTKIVSNLTDENVSVTDQLKSLEIKNVQAANRIKDLDESKIQLEEARNVLHQQKDKYKEKLEEAEKDHNKVGRKNTMLIIQKSKHIQELRKTIVHLEEKIRCIEMENSRYIAELDKGKCSIKELEECKATLYADHQKNLDLKRKTEEELKEICIKNQDSVKDNHEIKIKLDEISKALQESRSSNIEQREKYENELYAKQEEYSERLNKIEQEYDDVTMQLNTAHLQVAELGSKKALLHDKVTEQNKLIDNFNKDKDKLENEIALLHVSNEKLLNEIDKMFQQIHISKSETDNLIEQHIRNMKDLEQKLVEENEIAKTDLLKQIETLKLENTEIEKLQKCVEKETELGKKVAALLESEKSKNVKLQLCIDTLEKDKEQIEKSCDSLNATMTNIKEIISMKDLCSILNNIHSDVPLCETVIAESMLSKVYKNIVDVNKELKLSQNDLIRFVKLYKSLALIQKEKQDLDLKYRCLKEESDKLILESQHSLSLLQDRNMQLEQEKLILEENVRKYNEIVNGTERLMEENQALQSSVMLSDRENVQLKVNIEELNLQLQEMEMHKVRLIENTLLKENRCGQLNELLRLRKSLNITMLDELNSRICKCDDLIQVVFEPARTNVTEILKIKSNLENTLLSLRKDISDVSDEVIKSVIAITPVSCAGDNVNTMSNVTTEDFHSKESLSDAVSKMIEQFKLAYDKCNEYEKLYDGLKSSHENDNMLRSEAAKSDLLTMEKELEMSKRKLKDTRNTLNSVVASKCQLQQKVNALAEENKILQADKEAAISVKNTLVSKLSKIYLSPAGQTGENNVMSNGFQTEDNIIITLQQKYDNVFDRNNKLSEELASLKTQFTELQDKLHNQNQYDHILKENAQLLDQLNVEKNKNLANEKHVEQLQLDFCSMESKYKVAKTKFVESDYKKNKCIEELQVVIDNMQSNNLIDGKIEQKVKEVRNEYEGKLEKMKLKMKQLYTEEIAKAKEKQTADTNKLHNLCEKYKAKIAEYEKYVADLSRKHLECNERLNVELQKNASLKSDISYAQRARVETLPKDHLSSQVVEETTQITTRKFSLPVRNRTDVGPGLSMEDEQGEVFSSTNLTDLMAGRCEVPGATNNKDRLTEIQWRNSMCPPHLRSTYITETQFDEFKESDLKCLNGLPMDTSSSSLLPGEKSRWSARDKERAGTAYQKPGPPTPSKHGGRPSLQGNEIFSREALKEQNDNKTTGAIRKVKPTTPSRNWNLFGNRNAGATNKDNENESSTTPRRRLSIFSKKPR